MLGRGMAMEGRGSGEGKALGCVRAGPCAGGPGQVFRTGWPPVCWAVAACGAYWTFSRDCPMSRVRAFLRAHSTSTQNVSEFAFCFLFT